MKTIILISIFILSQQLVAQSIPYGYNDNAGGYFDVGNNTNLYYEIYGEGTPLLILHGGVFGYIDEFEYLIPKLIEKYQVICLATRGHVKSDIGNEPYTYEQRATDAFKLIQHLGINKVTVIGFSDGDEFSSPEELLAVHRYLPDSRLSIIPGCGHVILYCNFHAVWESMKIFLGFKD